MHRCISNQDWNTHSKITLGYTSNKNILIFSFLFIDFFFYLSHNHKLRFWSEKQWTITFLSVGLSLPQGRISGLTGMMDFRAEGSNSHVQFEILGTSYSETFGKDVKRVSWYYYITVYLCIYFFTFSLLYTFTFKIFHFKE